MKLIFQTVFAWMAIAASAIAAASKPMVSVDTVADLVGRNTVPNERVFLSGWDSAGDFGAQRIIRHDPTSVADTNLGCVYGSNGGGRYIAEDCESGEVDVRWFRAKGDGLTDDGVAMNAAIQYAGAEKSIRVPKGTYKLSTFIVLTNGTRLIGDGIEKTILLRDGLDTQTNSHLYATIQTPGVFNPYTGNGGHTNGYVNCTVTNIVLRDFTVATHPGSYPGFGIALFATKDSEVTRVGVRDCTNHWAITYLGDNTVVNGLQIRNTGWIYRDGSHMIGGNGFTLANSIIESGDDSIAFTGGWALDVPIKNVSVANCVTKSTHGHAIRISIENESAINQYSQFEIDNITGYAGLERNGLIYCHSASTNLSPAIVNVSIRGVRLQHGGQAGHGGVAIGAAYGVHLASMDNVLLSDVNVGQTPYRNFYLHDSGRLTLMNCTGDGPQTNFIAQTIYASNVSSLNLIGGRYANTNTIDTDTVTLTDIDEFKAVGTEFHHNLSGRSCIGLSGGIGNTHSFTLIGCTLTNASGISIQASTNPTAATLIGNRFMANNSIAWQSNAVPLRYYASENSGIGVGVEMGNSSTEPLQVWKSNVGAVTNPNPSVVRFRISGTYPEWYDSPYYVFTDTISNSASKTLRFGTKSYDTAQLPFFALNVQGLATENWVNYGGGSSLGSAATQHRFFIGEPVGTALGTNMVTFDQNSTVHGTPLWVWNSDSNVLQQVVQSSGVLNFSLLGGNSSNFFRGDGVFTNIVPIAPTSNGAYVLFVTNGVASWIAHP